MAKTKGRTADWADSFGRLWTSSADWKASEHILLDFWGFFGSIRTTETEAAGSEVPGIDGTRNRGYRIGEQRWLFELAVGAMKGAERSA